MGCGGCGGGRGEGRVPAPPAVKLRVSCLLPGTRERWAEGGEEAGRAWGCRGAAGRLVSVIPFLSTEHFLYARPCARFTPHLPNAHCV